MDWVFKSSLHFQIQKVQAAFWVCAANGAASAICSLPRGGGLGGGLWGRTANSGAGCFLRVGMAAIRHAQSLNFPLPVRVCPLPNPFPRERGWVQAALKVSGNL